jgi:hypothetical protein
MIHPLLIARKENAGILRNICKELETAMPREQIGDKWSLALFIKSDLKNYGAQTHFVLDVSAFKEKGGNFINLLEALTLLEKRIIIYAEEYRAGDDFLSELVNAGYTNIVARSEPNSTDKDLQADLKECFSPDGLSTDKFKIYDKAYKETLYSKPVYQKREVERDYSAASFTVFAFGAQQRIGTTKFALHVCDYITRKNGTAAFVSADKAGDYFKDVIAKKYNAKDNGAYYTINNIDFYTSPDVYAKSAGKKTYNTVVYDFGAAKGGTFDTAKSYKENAEYFLCCGVGYNEIRCTKSIQSIMTDLNYTIIVMFSDAEECESLKDDIADNLSNVVPAPYSPRLFNAKENDTMFDSLFEAFQTTTHAAGNEYDNVEEVEDKDENPHNYDWG